MEDTLWTSLAEGQLAVDVAETAENVYIRAVIAGVPEEEIDIHVTDDTITIRGIRSAPTWEGNVTIHFSEVFFGPFSRSIILPSPIKPDETQATVTNGMLNIIAPKAKKSIRLKINE